MAHSDGEEIVYMVEPNDDNPDTDPMVPQPFFECEGCHRVLEFEEFPKAVCHKMAWHGFNPQAETRKKKSGAAAKPWICQECKEHQREQNGWQAEGPQCSQCQVPLVCGEPSRGGNCSSTQRHAPRGTRRCFGCQS